MADVAGGAGFMVHGQASDSSQTGKSQTDDGQTDSGWTDNVQANDSSNIDVKFSSPVAVRDVQAVALARRQNIASNGRLFCLMLFCVCLLLWLFSPDHLFMWLALLSTLPVGGAVAADVLAGSLASGRASTRVSSLATSRNGSVAAGQAGSTCGDTAGITAGNTPSEVANRQAGNSAGKPVRNATGTPFSNSSARRALGALHVALCGVNAGVPVAVFIITLLNIG
jgi:hypothetical protein